MEATDEQLGVVFVHGFRSSAAMWDDLLQLIDSDRDLAFVKALPFPYSTKLWSFNPLRRIPSFNDAADSLRQFLAEGQAGGFHRLVLVSHSQGGLVVQRYLHRMLVDGQGKELTRIRRIVLFACPNTGSRIGMFLRRLILLFNPQERELRPFSPHVADAHRTVINQVVHAQEVTTSTCPVPIAAYAGLEDRVVPPASARSVFREVLDLPGDHFGIVRPDSHQHRSYGALKELLLLANARSGPSPETFETISAERLGVHDAVLPGGGESYSLLALTPYLLRDHDAELLGVLEPVLDGGPSMLVMLTGGSSTGKTRALYEALHTLAPKRTLLRPANVNELLDLLEEDGQIEPGVVLWLNEAQKFLDCPKGEDVAVKLTATLERQPGVLVVGTLWTDPYWRELTAPGKRGDPHGQARALLTGRLTRRIPVRAKLSEEDLGRWRDLAERSGDERMTHALRAGRRDAHVVQHLSGGPELLKAYRLGPGEFFNHQEHALITAALGARRLGHRTPLPAALLAEAANGALAPRYHSGDARWAERALHALSVGERGNGYRIDIRHTLTALTELHFEPGAPAFYEPDDYLEQQARTLRIDQVGTPSLWEALTTHASDPDDLARLAYAAWKGGVYKQAVWLGRRAVLTGHHHAPSVLVRTLHGPLDPHHYGARWVAFHANLEHPQGVALLLDALRNAGKEEAIRILLDRIPAAHTELTSVSGAAALLEAMRKAGAAHAAIAGAVDQAVTRADLDHPEGVAMLLDVLRKAGEEEAARKLLDRDPATQADLTNPQGAAMLLEAMRKAGAAHAAIAGAVDQAVTQADLTRPWGAAALLTGLGRADADASVIARLVNRAVTEADLTEPQGAVAMLEALQGVDADASAIARLVDRTVTEADLTHPQPVATLLNVLRKAGEEEAVRKLLDRDPAAQADLTHPYPVAALLHALRKAEDGQGVRTLLNRDPAAQTDVSHREVVAHLQSALRKVGEAEAAARLDGRVGHSHAGNVYGWEANGRPAAPWTWSDIPFPSESTSSPPPSSASESATTAR